MKKKLKTKSYKQKYEELLLEQHTKKYIHIPFNWNGILRFFIFLGCIGLSILNFLLIISTWKLLKLRNVSENYLNNFNQLLILYPLIGEYLLIGLSFICLVALIKGGFNKLKSIEKEGLIFALIGGLIGGLIFGQIGGPIGGPIGGLIFGLIFGLIGGLISGLISGLIFGLIFGLISGLIGGLISGLISGLIFGLIFGLSFGLISGLINEFD